jgi:hypothetical protein
MKVNSTLSMLPGGVLAQRLANDATNGKSGDTLAKFVPDPVHIAIADAKVIAKTIATDPKNTLSATKAAIQDNRTTIAAIGTNNTRAITTIAAPANLSKAVSIMEKPSLISMVSTVVKPASTLSAAPSTLKTSLLSTVAEVPKLKSLSTPLVMLPVAAMSTLSHDITASVVKPLTGSTLPIVGKDAQPSVSNVPVISTLSQNTDSTVSTPTSTLTNTLPVASITPVILPGSTTLSKPSAPEPSVEFGYLPIVGILGAIGLFMRR